MPVDGPSRADTPLIRFLLGDDGATPSVDELRKAGLVGHAFTRLPRHPQRSELRQGFLHIAARHVMVRRVLATLLRRWNEAGITPYAFKGFHLAEYVYGAPGHRGYADVDLLVREHDVPTACDLAAASGWEVAWRFDGPDGLHARHGPTYRGHEAASLALPAVDVRLDLHRRIVHNIDNWRRPEAVTHRLTDAAIACASVAGLDGAALRVPCPEDAVVFGLALNRCWGSDNWRIKPRDYADMEAIRDRFGVARREIRARADELGVAATVARYLDRCDPERGRLDARAPTWWALRTWNLAASCERGPIDPLRASVTLGEVGRDATSLARVLPIALDTVRRVRRDPGWRPRPSRTGARRKRVGAREWRRLRHALHRSMRLLRVPDPLRDRTTVFAAFRILRRRGEPVDLDWGSTTDAPAASPRLVLEGRMVRTAMAHIGEE